jgi:hypothetical protein
MPGRQNGVDQMMSRGVAAGDIPPVKWRYLAL